jgi:hypothetical protein
MKDMGENETAVAAEEKPKGDTPRDPNSKTSKRIAAWKAKRAQMRADGLRRVDFVIDRALWNQFLALRCGEIKPNVLFGAWIQSEVDKGAAE